METASGGGGGVLDVLTTAVVDGGSSDGMNSWHGSPLSTDLCIDESGWYVQTSLTLTPSTPAVPHCCCWKGPAPYWYNPPVLFFDIQALWRSVLNS